MRTINDVLVDAWVTCPFEFAACYESQEYAVITDKSCMSSMSRPEVSGSIFAAAGVSADGNIPIFRFEFLLCNNIYIYKLIINSLCVPEH